MPEPQSLLREATARLTGPSAPAEARTLLAHVLGRTAGELIMVDQVSAEQAERFSALVDERAAGRPLQHLTGVAHFRHSTLSVGPGVFVPRPETEVMTGHVVDELRRLVEKGRQPVAVDLCTGSGAIVRALADEVPDAVLHACELSEDAMAYAIDNLAGTGVDLVRADLADAFAELDGTVDVVVCNPPYIPLEAWESVTAEVRDHDPQLALFSGEDGLDAMRVLARTAARLVKPGGLLAAEHAEVQHESVVEVFVAQGSWTSVVDHEDLTGRPRFVTARRR
ncbi:peptide chain release factor N(5)-glutamine methyltransferase [Propionibacteriaceae bacterium Y1700]|uniref:peptide chain release factor N(5)-glutamine methyltransferase n=1 Tax=Microlunatus sp. Y1700 TaxID=3418487 RepID=UPI003DA6E2E0